MWTRLPFGKYIGETLPQVLLTDPDWFYWAAVKSAIFWGPLESEATDLAAKAARIKIPMFCISFGLRRTAAER